MSISFFLIVWENPSKDITIQKNNRIIFFKSILFIRFIIGGTHFISLPQKIVFFPRSVLKNGTHFRAVCSLSPLSSLTVVRRVSQFSQSNPQQAINCFIATIGLNIYFVFVTKIPSYSNSFMERDWKTKCSETLYIHITVLCFYIMIFLCVVINSHQSSSFCKYRKSAVHHKMNCTFSCLLVK